MQSFLFQTSPKRIFFIIVITTLICLGIVIALAPEENYYLTVEVQGEGNVFPPPGANYCNLNVPAYLSATPKANTGQGFIRWEGDVSSDKPNITITMNRNKRVVAVFSSTPPEGRTFTYLSIACAGPSTGLTSPSPGHYVHVPGTTVDIKALTGKGAYFAGWTQLTTEEEIVSLSDPILPSLNLKMDRDWVVIARFQPTGYHVSFEQEGEGLIVPPVGTYALAKGIEWSATATPKENWRLHHWIDSDGVVVVPPSTDTIARLTFTVERDVIYRAMFEKAERTLTLRIACEAGAIGNTEPPSSVSGETYTVPYGETFVVQAVPGSSESAFAGWSGDLPNETLPEALLVQKIELPMTENRILTAQFCKAQTQLTLEGYLDGVADTRTAFFMTPPPGIYGFVSRDGVGTTVSVPLVPGAPFAFSHWAGDLPPDVEPSERELFLPMNQHRRLIAHFVQEKLYYVDLSHSGDGIGRTDPEPGRYALLPGQTLALRAIPEKGNVFGGWRIHCADEEKTISVENPLSLGIDTSTEIVAWFGQEPCYVWIDVSEPSIEVIPRRGEYILARGALIELNAPMVEGKQFYHWKTSEGQIISEQPNLSVAIEKNLGYIAVYGPPLLTIKTIVSGSGVGTVESDVADLDRIVYGSTVCLRANPSPESLFVRWEGNLPSAVDRFQPEIIVPVMENISLCAVFEKADVQLVLEIEGLEEGQHVTVHPSPGVRGFRKNEEVTLRAFPSDNGEVVFVGWSGDISSINSECRITLESTKHVKAIFSKPDITDSVLLTLLPPEGNSTGFLWPVGPGRYRFSRGAQVTLSLALGERSYFAGWQQDLAGEIQYNNLSITLDRDKTTGPLLSDRGVTVVLMLDGSEGGSIYPPPGIYHLAEGMNVKLSAKRTNTRFSFVGWHGPDGTLFSTHGIHQLTISSDLPKLEIIAVFRKYIAPPELVFCKKF